MADSRRMLAQPIRSLAFGSIVAGYTEVGTPLTSQIRILHVTNLTDATLMFSFTGNNDHLILPSSGFLLLDITANEISDSGFFIAENTQMFVKRVGTPTTGAVYISAFFAAKT